MVVRQQRTGWNPRKIEAVSFTSSFAKAAPNQPHLPYPHLSSFPALLKVGTFLTSSMLVPEFCPTLCNPMDCNPLGSSVHGIIQARILEWVAISFSRGSSWKIQESNLDPGIKPRSPALQVDSLPSEPQEKLIKASGSAAKESQHLRETFPPPSQCFYP